jgi:hypothetical protein
MEKASGPNPSGIDPQTRKVVRPSLPTDGMTAEERRTWRLARIAERKKAERNTDVTA